MKMEQRINTEIARNNRVGMLAHATDATVMVIYSIIQTYAGLHSGLYAVLMVILGIGPVVAEYVCWKKDPATPAFPGDRFCAVLQCCAFYIDQQHCIRFCNSDDPRHLYL